MRVALFHNANGGGQKRAIYHLCQGLLQKGHQIDVFVPETANEHYLPLSSLGVEVNVFKISPHPKTPNLPLYLAEIYLAFFQRVLYLRKHRRLSRKIAAVINEKKYDVVWVDKCFVTSSPFIFRFLSAPTIYYCHEPSREAFEAEMDGNNARYMNAQNAFLKGLYERCDDLHRWYLRKTERFNVRYASKILTNSHYTSGFIQKALHQPALVNYLGVRIDVFRPLNIKKEHFVLSVGNLWPGKRHELTIQALSQIPQAKRPKFVIITDAKWSLGRIPALESLASSLGVELEFKLNVSDSELVEWYNRAGVVVYAAYREPFGLVAIEAMACGAPIVGACDAGLKESIRHGRTGMLVEPSAPEFARAIETILNCAELQERFGKAGVDYVRQYWTWDRACSQFEGHLSSVVESAVRK